MAYMRNGFVYTGDDPNTALLLVTGQVTQYSGELDDGYYEAGESRNYEILTTGQYAGACVFVLDGKTENQSHNCVEDLRTGRMWARYTSAYSASVGPASDGKMPWTGANDSTFQYCAAANVAELGGYSDWRIPNDTELASLRNMEVPTAVPDATAFPSWPAAANYLWASTSRPIDTNRAMIVNFNDGYVSSNTKITAWYSALVRGGV